MEKQLLAPSGANTRDMHLDPTEGFDLASQLSEISDRYNDRRVLVLGSPASGKSTLLQHMPGIDMDVVFDTMPEDFKRFVLHHEHPFMYVNGDRKTIKYTERAYIPEDPASEAFLRLTGAMLRQYTNEYMKITPGLPVFGTSLIDSDVVIHLNPSANVLDERINSRNTKTHRPVQRARIHAIKKIIDEDVESARDRGIIIEDFSIN